jgi:hypothetical protein
VPYLERIGGLLGPAGLSAEDQRRLGQQSLLAAGLGILANNGPNAGQAIGRGLLTGMQTGAQSGQVMLERARQEAELQRQKQMRDLAQQYAGKGENAGFDYSGYTQALAGLDPESAAKLSEYLSRQKLDETQIDKLQNPQTNDMLEYEYAKKNGFGGSFADWQRRSRLQSAPAGIQEYQYAVDQGYQGTLQDWLKDRASMKSAYGFAGLAPAENEALTAAVAAGKLDPSKLNSRTAKIFAQMLLSGDQDLNFNRLSADAALQRNAQFQQRTMALEALPEVMQTMTELGKKVGYSDVRAVGKMQAWAKGQLNDPDWQEYMTVRNDALMTVASVMRGVGMSDKAHEAEIEAANPTMSPSALDAWLRAQTHALEPRLKRVEKVKNLGETPKPNTQPQSGAMSLDDYLKSKGF